MDEKLEIQSQIDQLIERVDILEQWGIFGRTLLNFLERTGITLELLADVAQAMKDSPREGWVANGKGLTISWSKPDQ